MGRQPEAVCLLLQMQHRGAFANAGSGLWLLFLPILPAKTTDLFLPEPGVVS